MRADVSHIASGLLALFSGVEAYRIHSKLERS